MLPEKLLKRLLMSFKLKNETELKNQQNEFARLSTARQLLWIEYVQYTRQHQVVCLSSYIEKKVEWVCEAVKCPRVESESKRKVV